MDQSKTPDATRRLAAVLVGNAGFGLSPAMTSPGTPVDLTKTLRAAFAKSLASPELFAEAVKKTMEVELITGEELETLAKEVVNQPPDIIARMNKLLGE